MSSESGIYRILNTVNGKVYVGSAVRLAKRWNDHRCDLNKGCHVNSKLQRAWSKYGSGAFRFETLELVADVTLLIAAEQKWIDSLNAKCAGYNIAPTAGSQLGLKHSEETRRRLSEAHTGRKRAPEAIEKTARALRGRPKTPEHIANATAARSYVVSDETRAKISAVQKGQKRGPRSAETRAKISAAHKGKSKGVNGWTDERRKAMSERMKGQRISPETIAKRVESRARNKASLAAAQA